MAERTQVGCLCGDGFTGLTIKKQSGFARSWEGRSGHFYQALQMTQTELIQKCRHAEKVKVHRVGTLKEYWVSGGLLRATK